MSCFVSRKGRKYYPVHCLSHSAVVTIVVLYVYIEPSTLLLASPPSLHGSGARLVNYPLETIPGSSSSRRSTAIAVWNTTIFGTTDVCWCSWCNGRLCRQLRVTVETFEEILQFGAVTICSSSVVLQSCGYYVPDPEEKNSIVHYPGFGEHRFLSLPQFGGGEIAVRCNDTNLKWQILAQYYA